MAKEIKKVQKGKKKVELFSIPLSRQNFIIFGIGIIGIVIGFFVMTIPPWDSFAALVIAPIILVISYFVIFPYGILRKPNKNQTPYSTNK